MSSVADSREGEVPALLASSNDDFLGEVALWATRSCAPAVTGSLDEAFGTLQVIRSTFQRAGTKAVSRTQEGAPLGTVFPGYKLLEEVGRGAFGVVYRALDETLGREVALKVLLSRRALTADEKARFLKEARSLAQIRHPNVLQVHGVVEKNGALGLAMEFIHGRTLEKVIESNGPLAVGEAVHVGAELCRALSAVHQSGLIHRDVKPANVLREEGGRIVLADFGLGLLLEDALFPESSEHLSGTPLFMAPEQVKNRPIDARTDLYSLGVILYYLVTGKYPFKQADMSSLARLLRAIESGAQVPIRDARADLPEAFVRIIARALASDPAARFQSAGEMEQALIQCIDGRAHSGVAAARPPSKRSRPLLVAAVAAALLLAGGAVVWRQSHRLPFEATMGLAGALKDRLLAPGEKIAVGDQLFLQFHATEVLHVYVLSTDEKGSLAVLFPREDLALQNPLSAGLRELPGPTLGGKAEDRAVWPVTTKGGVETFTVAAAPEPVAEIEDFLRARRAESSRSGEVAVADPKDVPRGAEGIQTVKRLKGSEAHASLERLAARWNATPDGGRTEEGIWVRHLVFANPTE